MKLSKNQLLILADKLLEIINEDEVTVNDDDEFICDVDFEDMLSLVLDIDGMSANKIYQKIHQDIDITMGLPILAEIINKHISEFTAN